MCSWSSSLGDSSAASSNHPARDLKPPITSNCSLALPIALAGLSTRTDGGLVRPPLLSPASALRLSPTSPSLALLWPPVPRLSLARPSSLSFSRVAVSTKKDAGGGVCVCLGEGKGRERRREEARWDRDGEEDARPSREGRSPRDGEAWRLGDGCVMRGDVYASLGSVSSGESQGTTIFCCPLLQ